jgi:hypothetical protein
MNRVYHQWMRLEVMDQWWHWLIFACVLTAVFTYAVYWYRRDWTELPKPLGWTLLLLRLIALIGIVVFFMDLQRRSEQKLVRPSRVAVLIDTSLSMSLPYANATVGANTAARIDTVVDFLKTSSVVPDLRKEHDLAVYRFDQTQRPTLLTATAKPKDSSSDSPGSSAQADLWRALRRIVLISFFCAVLALLFLIVGLIVRLSGSKAPAWPYVILFSVVGLICSLTFIGTTALRGSQFPFLSFWKNQPPDSSTLPNNEGRLEKSAQPPTPDSEDWLKTLAAVGVETRIGDAVQAVLEQERSSPLAGIILITDGQNNAGAAPIGIVGTAVASGVPIYSIGVGSPDDPINVRIVDLEAPKRVYPGDRFRITALVQAAGLEGKKCSVQLRRRSSGSSTDNLAIEEEVQVELSANDDIIPVNFDVKPREIGGWVYDVKLLPPSQDSNPQDNQLDVEVRVVEPRSTVLVIAGGPTRDYQFVRNLLFRDKTVQSHVYLQSGGPGISQEADKLLTEFPDTLAEMSEYDCVIAFDADWMSLSVQQLEVLEKWVAQQAGGLVLILGPVASPKWTGTAGNGDRRAELMRNLSPIVLNGRGSRLVSMGRFESETVWPIRLSEASTGVDFLDISGNTEESRNLWNNFAGVYSFYAGYEPKAGALPIAYFSDPSTSLDGKLPIYLAGQFYGAGRVVAQGSGEMWRMRQLSDDYFDTYYTKLIRWAAQSRLLRDSDRGMLLLDKQQALIGEQINVRAVLRDEQFQPLVLPSVTGKVADPSSRVVPIELTPLQDPSQLGTYIGQFLVKQTGTYEVRLPVGSLADQQMLSQQVTVRVPTREIQRPQRNDPLLIELAQKTGGAYFTDLSTASEITAKIAPRDQIQFLPGAPDREFQLRLMATLLTVIGTALSLEWFIRRLSKLA